MKIRDSSASSARSGGTPVLETFEGVYASGLLASLKKQNLALDHLRRALENELARPSRKGVRRRHPFSQA